MEGEVNNLILVSSTAVASLFFCHRISTVTAQGTTRLCTFLPFIFVFLYLPLRLTTVNFSGTVAFFVSWLANFKLILFAFHKGPLFSDPPLPLSKFVLATCLPIKIIENQKKSTKIVEVCREDRKLPQDQDVSREVTKSPQIDGVAREVTESPRIDEVSREVKKAPQIDEVSGEHTKSTQTVEVTRKVTESPQMEEGSRKVTDSAQIDEVYREVAESAKMAEASRKVTKSPWIYLVKFLGFLVLVRAYEYHESFGPVIKLALFCVHIYLVLDVGLAMVAYAARAVAGSGLELEPQFNEPYLATSLQDFWGRRWNLMVTGILRPTVYLPVRSFAGGFLPEKWASLPAVLASFLVSGLMHELIFYYMGRLRPTWEVTWFFVIHGVLVAAEVVAKRAVGGGFRLPATVSRAATLGVVAATSFWLFFPPFLRFDVEVRSCKEMVAFLELVVRGRFVGPNDVSCPYF